MKKMKLKEVILMTMVAIMLVAPVVWAEEQQRCQEVTCELCGRLVKTCLPVSGTESYILSSNMFSTSEWNTVDIIFHDPTTDRYRSVILNPETPILEYMEEINCKITDHITVCPYCYSTFKVGLDIKLKEAFKQWVQESIEKNKERAKQQRIYNKEYRQQMLRIDMRDLKEQVIERLQEIESDMRKFD